MKKILCFGCVCLLCWWMFDSCGGDSDSSSGSQDTRSEQVEEKESERYNHDFSDFSLHSPADVYGFLSGKEFTDGRNRMEFTGSNTGSYCGNYFTITRVQVVNEKTAKLEITFPTFPNPAIVTLTIYPHDAMITDTSIGMGLSLSDGGKL